MSERVMLLPGKASARQVGDNALANARHVVEEWGDHRCGQHVDCSSWQPLFQQLYDRVTANEIADPHVRNDQKRRV
jgi:hypothetical protein